jgi:hypothetical protein
MPENRDMLNLLSRDKRAWLLYLIAITYLVFNADNSLRHLWRIWDPVAYAISVTVAGVFAWPLYPNAYRWWTIPAMPVAGVLLGTVALFVPTVTPVSGPLGTFYAFVAVALFCVCLIWLAVGFVRDDRKDRTP